MSQFQEPAVIGQLVSALCVGIGQGLALVVCLIRVCWKRGLSSKADDLQERSLHRNNIFSIWLNRQRLRFIMQIVDLHKRCKAQAASSSGPNFYLRVGREG
jgi:hypothetical protein